VLAPRGTVLSSAAFHVEKVPSTVFVPVTTALSGVSGSQLGASTFADLDGDGLLDLLVGERTSDRLKHYEQDALNSASFTLRTSDFSGIRVSAAAAPAITDFDGDGLLDLIVGERDQQVSLYEQDAPHSTSFSLRRANFIQTLQNGGALDYYLAPTVTDIDGDGLLDLLLGGEYGTVWRYEQGAANSTDFPLVNYGIDNMNFGGISVLIDSNPAVVDLEGDGLLDILAGPSDQEGITHYRQAAINSEGFTQVTQVFSGITAPNYEAKPTITDLDGDGRLDLLLGFNGSSLQRYEQVGPVPVLTSLSAPSGPIGASITLMGTNLDGATAVSFNGTPATSFTSSSATSVTVTVPAGATTGPVTLTTPGGTSNSLTFTILSDLTVSTVGQTIGGGTYHNITVTGTGEATLGGDLTVTGALVVQDGGALADGCHIIRGAGAFSLQAGAALSICAAAGISASGATGAVQVTGARSFAADATYRYVGTQAQVTGAALPSSVRELAVANTAGVTLSQATAVTNVLRLSSGVLSTSSNALTLLSTTSRTAYAVHAGGTTSGAVTVQRYVGGPTAVSYHHLASPVQNSTVSDLATAGFTPVVNAAYNALPYVAPPARQFPNVFGYDEQRGGTATAYQGFGIGYYSPASLSSALTPGRGWSVALAGDKTPDFVGALTTGSLNVALSHTGTNSSTNKAGWHLLGNPYPQPIDWDLVATPANVEASVYVWYPTGGNNGAYRVRNASGVGNLTEGLIGVSQGFWVRTTAPATFPFSNALRVENDAVPLGRMAAGSRPRLTLTLAQVGAPAELTDEVTVYAEPDATRGFDGAYDATRPGRNVGVPTLSVLIDGQEAMISALPDASFTAGASVELLLDVPAAGTYTLTAATLTNLPNALLLDRVTNTTYDLTSQPTLAFATAAGEVRDRFALLFGARVLGVAAEATTPAFALYPNPARGVVRVAGAVTESATLLDATGRTVRVWTLAPGATADLSLAGLTPGVYTVRVGTTSRRLVIE
jgi:FG-GAP-like repeat/IPT/TIG domain